MLKAWVKDHAHKNLDETKSRDVRAPNVPNVPKNCGTLWHQMSQRWKKNKSRNIRAPNDPNVTDGVDKGVMVLEKAAESLDLQSTDVPMEAGRSSQEKGKIVESEKTKTGNLDR